MCKSQNVKLGPICQNISQNVKTQPKCQSPSQMQSESQNAKMPKCDPIYQNASQNVKNVSTPHLQLCQKIKIVSEM